MIPITQLGALTANTVDILNQNFSSIGVGVGNAIYVDPVNGNDNSGTGEINAPVATLSVGYGLATSGNNDVIYLVGNGATTGTARLSATFTWAKNATHLVGVSSGVSLSNRSRIAPTSGATAFTPFFTVSGSGCLFQNIQWFDGFGTGTTSQIGLSVTGGRNLFQGCHIAGMGDAESAASAGSRTLKISTTGENMFVDCTIGIDTVTRTAANASVEFSGGAPRNQFVRCVFPFMTSAATPLGIIVSAAAGSDRFQFFNDCVFINAINSTSTTMSGLATLAASMGGMLLFKDATLVGITEFGTDATSLAQIYVDGGTVTAATSGIAVNPS